MENRLSIQDFTFVGGDERSSPSYQYGPFTIVVGRETYICNYKDCTFSFGHKSITEAVEACNRRAKNGPVGRKTRRLG
jgi:hypothetical protein